MFLFGWGGCFTLLFWMGVGATVGYFIGNGKGRGQDGAMWGMLLGPLGWIIATTLDDRRPKCPHCFGPVAWGASRCSHCHGEMKVVEAPVELQAPLAPAPEREPINWRPFAILMGSLVALLAGVFSVVWLLERRDEKAEIERRADRIVADLRAKATEESRPRPAPPPSKPIAREPTPPSHAQSVTLPEDLNKPAEEETRKPRRDANEWIAAMKAEEARRAPPVYQTTEEACRAVVARDLGAPGIQVLEPIPSGLSSHIPPLRNGFMARHAYVGPGGDVYICEVGRGKSYIIHWAKGGQLPFQIAVGAGIFH